MSRSSRAPRRAALLAAFVLTWHAGARADSRSAPAPAPAPPSLEQVEAARVPFRESRELHRAGKLDEAIARMLAAYEMASTPVIALEAGRLLVEGGRLVRARDILRGVAGLPTSPRESEAGRDARRTADALATELDARIPKISLAERPRDVEVLLDGKPFALEGSDAWQSVDPGAHAIVVKTNDHACASIAITLVEGQAKTIDLRDAALACPPSTYAPAPPPSPISPPVVAEPPARPSAARASAAWPWAGVGLAGAGVVAVGVGMAVVFVAKANYDAVSSGCTASGCDPGAFDVRHRAHDQANIATVVAGVGGAAIGGGLLWVVLGRPARADSAAPRFGVGPSSVSLVVSIP